jgi:adhesin transport system outer membrane protein
MSIGRRSIFGDLSAGFVAASALVLVIGAPLAWAEEELLREQAQAQDIQLIPPSEWKPEGELQERAAPAVPEIPRAPSDGEDVPAAAEETEAAPAQGEITEIPAAAEEAEAAEAPGESPEEPSMEAPAAGETATAPVTPAPVTGAPLMEEAIRRAIATNPQIGIVTANREAIEEELRQARGLYFPQIDAESGVGWERTNDIASRSRFGAATDAGSVSMLRQENRVTLIQRVFDGFETDSTIDREKARVESAAKRVYENAEFLALDAIDAFLAVARQRELVGIAESNYLVHAELAESLRAQARAGAGSLADVAQADSRASRARATVAQAQNDLRDADALYIRVVGEAAGDTMRPTLPRDALPPDLELALELAAKNNPTVAIFEADTKVAGAETELAESRFYPAVNIEGESEYNDGRDGVETWERNHQIMARARWNLYRGGIDVANRREFVAREAEAKNRVYNSHIQSQEEMRRSWNAYIASQERTEALRDAVRHATATRDAYRQQFRVAQRSLLDVLDAENEYFVTRGQLVSAEYNEILSSFRILAVGGALLKTLGIEAPKAADPTPPSFWDQVVR